MNGCSAKLTASPFSSLPLVSTQLRRSSLTLVFVVAIFAVNASSRSRTPKGFNDSCFGSWIDLLDSFQNFAFKFLLGDGFDICCFGLTPSRFAWLISTRTKPKPVKRLCVVDFSFTLLTSDSYSGLDCYIKPIVLGFRILFSFPHPAVKCVVMYSNRLCSYVMPYTLSNLVKHGIEPCSILKKSRLTWHAWRLWLKRFAP